jgi:hypothetical protein
MSIHAAARAAAVALGCALVLDCAHRAPIVGAAPEPAAVPAWTDSSSQAPQAQIYRTWIRYLDSSGMHYRWGAFRPSPYWVTSEQHQWRVYALALSYLPDSAIPQVLSIDPVPDDSGEYRVVTRFTSTNEDNAMRSRTATVTVFAVPSSDGWHLANALPRLTKAWRRDTVGPITYVYAPTYRFRRDRAERAAAFVDSLAAALDVPLLGHIMYYLTSSDDEVYHIMGLDTDKPWGPVGGVAQPTNYQLFSGIPAVGEDYRHELTHIVILPLMTGRTTYLVSEGVPTWFGGTTGMDFRTAARGLAAYLERHPSVTLDSIMEGHYAVAQFYPAAAVLVSMVYARGGTAALKSLFDDGPSVQDLRGALERLFARPWADITLKWRHVVLGFGSAAAGAP